MTNPDALARAAKLLRRGAELSAAHVVESQAHGYNAAAKEYRLESDAFLECAAALEASAPEQTPAANWLDNPTVQEALVKVRADINAYAETDGAPVELMELFGYDNSSLNALCDAVSRCSPPSSPEGAAPATPKKIQECAERLWLALMDETREDEAAPEDLSLMIAYALRDSLDEPRRTALAHLHPDLFGAVSPPLRSLEPAPTTNDQGKI